MKKFFTPSIILLGFASLFNDISSEAIYPLLPIFLTSVLGASPFFIGLIEGIAESTASFVKLFSGYWSDRLGSKKPLVVTGYVLSNVAKPAMGLATSWPLVLVIRFMDRVGKGVRAAPRDAWIAGLGTKETLPFIYGFERGMDHIGAIVGPLLATAFLYYYPGNYGTLFLWTVVPGALAVVLISLSKESSQSEKIEKPKLQGAWKALPLPLKRYFALLIFFTLGNSSDAFLLLRLKQAGIGVVWLPIMWAGLHLVKMSSSFVSGRITQLLGIVNTLLCAWLIYAASYFGFAFVHKPIFLIVLFLFYGFYYGFSEGPERALIAELTPTGVRGSAFGVYALVTGMALLPASLFFGLLWSTFGMETAFIVGGALSLFSSLLLVRLFKAL